MTTAHENGVPTPVTYDYNITPGASMAPPARLHPKLGYAVGHILDDAGPVEWFEETDGYVHVHQTPTLARKARGSADPDTWVVLELRIVPAGGA